MRTFKDNTGQEWTVDMTVSALRRVKARIGFIPGTPGTDEVDLCTLVDTLYAVCVADPHGMPQNAFDERLDGALGKAVEVLTDEITDFFQRQGLAEENGKAPMAAQMPEELTKPIKTEDLVTSGTGSTV